MKAKQLAEMLLQNSDFEVVASFCEIDNNKTGYAALNYRKFSVDLGDIGYSSKVINLDLAEDTQ
jgi:hypothetical protein